MVLPDLNCTPPAGEEGADVNMVQEEANDDDNMPQEENDDDNMLQEEADDDDNMLEEEADDNDNMLQEDDSMLQEATGTVLIILLVDILLHTPIFIVFLLYHNFPKLFFSFCYCR